MRTPAILALAFCAAIGVFLRFHDLGVWPLATDEYFLYRATQFVADKGVPAFACGGYYVRGLLMQYLAAPLVQAGVSGEVVLRGIAAVFSLAAVVGSFRLARLCVDRPLAIAVAIVMLLSLWEIEMARFGRMYAPFQAIFVWYAINLIRFVRGGESRYFQRMMILTLSAILTWEGSIVLTLLNLLPLLAGRRLGGAQRLLALAMVVVFAMVHLVDHRSTAEDMAALRALTQAAQPDSVVAWRRHAVLLLASPSPWMLSIAAVFVFGIARELRLLTAYPRRVVVLFAIVAVLVLLNQILLAVTAFVIFLLVGGFRQDKEWSNAPVGRIVVWCGLMSASWLTSMMLFGPDPSPTASLRILIGFPDWITNVANPLLSAMPDVFLATAVAILLLTIASLRERTRPPLETRLLVAIVVLSALVIALADSKYKETRYVFFLYPALLVCAAAALQWIARTQVRTQTEGSAVPPGLSIATAAVLLVLFALSSDFRPTHLASLSSYAGNFRIDYPEALQRHLYPRFDFRSAAAFVNANASADDLVVIGSEPTAPYLDRQFVMFMDRADPRFVGQSCGNGARERWTGATLLSTKAELEYATDNASKVAWFIVDRQTSQRPAWIGFAQRHPLIAVHLSPDGFVTVYRRDAHEAEPRPDSGRSISY